MNANSLVSNLWCKEGTSDKVYRIELVSLVDGTYDVFSTYGRRGGRMSFHVLGESMNYQTAKKVAREQQQRKLRRGYREVVEDVAYTTELSRA
jgi:hypothetical protein